MLAERPLPKAGYFFRIVQKDPEGRAYSSTTSKHRNTSRFAICAYPAEHGKTGKHTVLISEENTLWKKDTGGKAVEQMPKNPLKEGWELLD